MRFQTVTFDRFKEHSGVKKNMKNSLTRRVIFGVTVANFEINYLNNEEVSEGTKNSSKVSRLCLIQWYVQNFFLTG